SRRFTQKGGLENASISENTAAPAPPSCSCFRHSVSRFLLLNFGLSDAACIWYKNRTHIPSHMNTPNSGPIIEVTNTLSNVGVQNETRAPRETKTAIHPFGSVLLRLQLALSLICIRRTPACPAEARTRVRSMG